MFKGWKQQFLRRLRNSESGQSILLLALGFIALAAFVGLVTDISIMFVRFATLRRAVDAAAISAAGQIREGTDYGTVALAARQYITLHGLQPHRVWVETCETQIAEWRKTHPEPTPVETMTEEDGDLCDFNNPRKLVRVVAQIDSETTFLKLINITDFIITSSATSETAALDIALVLDTSDSMAVETDLGDYQKWNLSTYQIGGYDINSLPRTSTHTSGSPLIPFYCLYHDVEYQLHLAQDSDPNTVPADPSNLTWSGCCNDPGASAYVRLDTLTGEWKIYTDGQVFNGTNAPGDLPYYPENYALTQPPGWRVQGANGKYDAGEEGFHNTIPDGDFTDLICQPFKQVKDAARNFIARLDFIRGDRLALVTFNRLANIVYPNNNDTNPPLITSEEDAMRTLDKFVGLVVNQTGQLAGCRIDNEVKQEVIDRAASPDLAERAITNNDLPINNRRPWSYDTIAQCTNTNIGDGIYYANVALTNPDTIRRDAVWVAILLTDGAANSSRNLTPAKAYVPYTSIDTDTVAYGDFGFCPWYTFCMYRPMSDPTLTGPSRFWIDGAGADANLVDWQEVYPQWNDHPPAGINYPLYRGNSFGAYNYPSYPECAASYATVPDWNELSRIRKFCNDGNPQTRHFCLQWSNDDNVNGLPKGFTLDADGDPVGAFLPGSPCGETGHYDADDYARDMADLAGLVEIKPGVTGNFIAIFSIGFGDDIVTDPTSAPLLRYIADAGDNGQIDNNREQDWRDNEVLNGNITGPNDPCYGAQYDADPKAWCGQYYYASSLQELDAVFEAIAGRLFTRIAR